MENHRKRWTKEEDEFLHEHVGIHTNEFLAKKLGRTLYSIETRLFDLGIQNKHLMTGTVTISELASIVGVDFNTIKRYWIRDGLKTRQLYCRSKTNYKNKHYFVYPEDFWKWAVNHKHRIDFTKIKRGMLNPEPEWLEIEIKKDYHSPKRQIKQWTDEQDEMLWDLYYKEGLTQKEIGDRMNKTKGSINMRLQRLRRKKLKTA